MTVRKIGDIEYIFTRKRVKNINLRIHTDGTVSVSAPNGVPLRAVDEFVLSKSDFIDKAKQKLSENAPEKACPKEYVSGEKFMYFGREITLEIAVGDADARICGDTLRVRLINAHSFALRKKAVNNFFDMQCELYFKELIEKYYAEFKDYGIAYPTLKIKDMKSRWGSCMPSRGVITLSKQLLAAPRECAEYVVVHEYCHFLEPNHSSRFYAHVGRHMPDWKNRKDRLNKCSINVF